MHRLPDVQVITRTQHRRAFSREQKLQIVKDAFSSGLQIAEYARQVEMAPCVLFKWRKMFINAGDIAPLPEWQPDGHVADANSDAFVHVANVAAHDATIRVLIGADIVVECSAATDPLQLAKLIRALRSSSPNAPGGVAGRRWRPSRVPPPPAPKPTDTE